MFFRLSFQGNYGLCRVLSQIYEVSPEKVAPNAPVPVGLVNRCDSQEKLALLQLFALIADKNSTVSVPYNYLVKI